MSLPTALVTAPMACGEDYVRTGRTRFAIAAAPAGPRQDAPHRECIGPGARADAHAQLNSELVGPQTIGACAVAQIRVASFKENPA
jgi:hypothetical protein